MSGHLDGNDSQLEPSFRFAKPTHEYERRCPWAIAEEVAAYGAGSVGDLLGGRVRDSVPLAAYLFYKRAEHPALDGRVAIGDDWGEALHPAGIVEQARLMQQRYGFRSFKLRAVSFRRTRRSPRSGHWRRRSPGSRCGSTPTRPGRWRRRRTSIEGMAQVAQDSPLPLAAMTHVAAAIPNLDHSCDTHYPWNFADDVIRPGVLEFRDGEVGVPTGPGLGVELDHEALERLHRLYVESGVRTRDDTGYMQRILPDYELRLPRW